MIADGVIHKIEDSTIHHFFQLFQEIYAVSFIYLLCHTQKIEIDSHLPTVKLEYLPDRAADQRNLNLTDHSIVFHALTLSSLIIAAANPDILSALYL